MRIYTTYFAKVRSLPEDVVPVSIAAYPPRGWNGHTLYALAPNDAILHKYKRDGDWLSYVRQYEGDVLIMQPEDIIEALGKLSGGRDVALVCFEKDHTRCHRSLVANWLSVAGYPCEEYNFNM